MFLADLGRMTPDQEAVYRELKHYFKEQRKVTQGKDARRAAGISRKDRRAVFKELRARFEAGADVDILAPSFDQVADEAKAAVEAEPATEAGNNLVPLAAALAAAFLMT